MHLENQSGVSRATSCHVAFVFTSWFKYLRCTQPLKHSELIAKEKQHGVGGKGCIHVYPLFGHSYDLLLMFVSSGVLSVGMLKHMSIKIHFVPFIFLVFLVSGSFA